MQAVRVDETQLEAAAVPLGVVQYVLRTKSYVLLEDAFHSGNFNFDPYISKHNTKSILCLPVLGQNKMVAVMYLENNLMPGFSPLLIIQFLSFASLISLPSSFSPSLSSSLSFP